MKNTFWKFVVPFLVALPVGFYTAFVAECFWNWFAVPAMHVPEIGFLPWLGLWWLIDLLFNRSSSGGDDKRWALMMSALELSIPEEKHAELKALCDPPPIETFLEGFSLVFGKIFSNTIALCLGFILHVIVS